MRHVFNLALSVVVFFVISQSIIRFPDMSYHGPMMGHVLGIVWEEHPEMVMLPAAGLMTLLIGLNNAILKWRKSRRNAA